MATEPPRYPALIDTLEKLDKALNYWKNTTFSQHYLKLDDVVASLRKPRGHLVDARQEFAARWILCPPGGRKPATMWTAAVWRWNSDLDTGNFVPPGETAPARLPESRIQTVPNNLCRFSYVLDTTHDKSLWEAQKVFEDHVTALNKFNPGKKPRREFQNGVTHTHTFHLSSQMFVKRTAYMRTKEASRTYPLHDWIKNATKKGTPFFANDEKPMLFELDEDGGLRPLSESYPPTLKVGDLVWMSLSTEFFIGNMYWSTNLIPYEFVRVGSVALELLPDIKKEFDEDEEEEGPRERLGVGMRGISASAARQLNEAGNLRVPHPEQLAGTTPELGHADLAVVEAHAIASALVLDTPDNSRNVLPANPGSPRSPRAFIDSESEQLTTSTDKTDDDDVISATHLDDDQSTMQEYMSVDDNSFIVDDDSSLTDVDVSFTGAEDGDASSFTGAKGDNAGSLTLDNASVSRASASVAGDEASVIALVGSTSSAALVNKQLNVVDQAEVIKGRTADAPAAPKPKGRKRPASSERVLRKRPAKGKDVAV